jgi:Ca-activated chloride channel family protein
VDDKAGLTKVLVDPKKVYLEMKNDDFGSAMSNPFVSYQISVSYYGSQIIGKEVVNGYPCTRRLTKSSGKDFLTAWFADRLDFPVKIVNHLKEGDFTELTNIEEGAQEAHLFRPPEGYVKMDRMPIDPPSWAGDVPKAPTLAVPFEKTLSKGEIVKAAIKKGFKIIVRGENLVEGRTAVTAVAFKDGNPVTEPSMSTFNVSRKGQKLAIAREETIAKADEIVIRVGEGKALIRTELEEAPEGIVLKKEYIKKMSGKDLRTYTDRPFRLVVRDEKKDGVDSRVKLIVYKGSFQNKEKIEEHNLDIKNGRSMSWQYPADKGIGTLSFDVVAGGIHVRLEYPEKEGATPPSWKESPLKEKGSQEIEGTGATKTRAGEKTTGKATVEANSLTDGPAAIMFILDASGSMWGQIGGQPKIAIAKAVLTDLINDLPDDSHAGLVAYGHRRKRDCQDVEELVSLQPIDKKSLIAKIKAIGPKGKTPITLSIRKTAEKLKSIEEETTIILVSDGKETCEGDPCALVKELKAAGIRFTMYVIGFDVSEEEKAQLECIAQAGGGQYFTAKTAQEFRVAAKEAVKKSQSFGYLKITALRSGKPISARVDIFAQGEKKTVKSVRSVTEPALTGSKLKPGVYDLTITDREVRPPQKATLSGVTVTAGATTEKSVDFSGGGLSVAVLAEGRKETAGLYVYRAGEKQPLVTGDTSSDNPKTFALGPGIYDLRVLYKKVRPEMERRFSDIRIEAGQTIEKRVEFGEGRLSIEVLVNGKKGSAGYYVFDAGTTNRVTSGDTSSDNPKIVVLNPGTYDLQVVYKGSKPETKQRFNGIEIKPGRTEERKAEFGEGRLSIEVLVNGKKGSAGYYVFDAGTTNRVTSSDTSSDNPRVINLNAGNYDLKVVYRKAIPEKEIVLKDIEVVQAQTSKQRVEYQEGILNVKVTSGGQSTRGGLSFFRDGESRRFATGNAEKPIKMQPGHYEVVVKAYKLEGKPEKRFPFTIQAGQTTNLDVVF